VVTFLLAFMLRFDGFIPQQYWDEIAFALPALMLAKGAVAYRYGLHKGLLPYVGMDDLVRIAKAATIASVAFLVYAFAVHGHAFPRSVFLMDWILTMGAYGGVRVSARLWQEWRRHRETRQDGTGGRRTLVIGAGNAGEEAVRSLKRSFHRRYQVVGFLDDDPVKQGMMIHGAKVLGPIRDASKIVERYEVTEVLIAITGIPKSLVREVVDSCSGQNVRFLILPALRDVLSGSIQVDRIRDVQVEDLLGRDPIELDHRPVMDEIRGKCVLVTGAGGSIGSEMARQVAAYGPRKLVLLDAAETPLFEIDREIRHLAPAVDCEPYFGDIKHADSMEIVFREFRPDVVYHAAAYKHVPMMEKHPVEAVLNNVIGTRHVAEAAARHGAKRFVMISTDKAVRPSSVMGATKRLAELLVTRLNGNGTKFIAVRFGNVLGSNGSVVPIFRRQIEDGGPVTVTHPDMTRFFMTIPEAVELVLQAGTMGHGGDVFVLDMGEQIRILDLARNMIELSGLRPDDDIEIEFTGLRPGEKLYEELVAYGEDIEDTEIPKLRVLRCREHSTDEIETYLAQLAPLHQAALARDDVRTRALIWQIIAQHDLDVNCPKADAEG
jgi:FlaA1/EpsC-like NDP-sugar epimerase